jgi:hypothetical protein
MKIDVTCSKISPPFVHCAGRITTGAPISGRQGRKGSYSISIGAPGKIQGRRAIGG